MYLREFTLHASRASRPQSSRDPGESLACVIRQFTLPRVARCMINYAAKTASTVKYSNLLSSAVLRKSTGMIECGERRRSNLHVCQTRKFFHLSCVRQCYTRRPKRRQMFLKKLDFLLRNCSPPRLLHSFTFKHKFLK